MDSAASPLGLARLLRSSVLVLATAVLLLVPTSRVGQVRQSTESPTESVEITSIDLAISSSTSQNQHIECSGRQAKSRRPDQPQQEMLRLHNIAARPAAAGHVLANGLRAPLLC